MAEVKATPHTFKLAGESELRFQVDNKNEKVILELKTGQAEIFGLDLMYHRKYEYTFGAKIAVFTWEGCILEMVGKPNVSYITNDTPMVQYMNSHAVLEDMRHVAKNQGIRGPITMIVGPNDAGKSTLTEILLNYGVMAGRRPIFVDLDVSQGHLSLPGTIGAVTVEKSSKIAGGFGRQAPLAYHFGHECPSSNIEHYNSLVTRLAKRCLAEMKANEESRVSGMFINTCGWVKGDGYELLTHAAHVFNVNTILVLGQENLYSKLVKDQPYFVKVVLLPTSSGVVKRSRNMRIDSRNAEIRKYFYGFKNTLDLHSLEIKWSDASICRMGENAGDNLTKLVAVRPGPNLVHHLLSVLFSDSPEKIDNISGYVCVTHVDVNKKTITLLSRLPRLHKAVFLLSDTKFMDC